MNQSSKQSLFTDALSQKKTKSRMADDGASAGSVSAQEHLECVLEQLQESSAGTLLERDDKTLMIEGVQLIALATDGDTLKAYLDKFAQRPCL